jgi:hypothetical protein
MRVGMFRRHSMRILWCYYFVDLMMSYLGYFYVKAKAFEVLSEIGNKGICFAETGRDVYQAMCLAKLTMGWLSKTVEELIKGDQNQDYYRTFRAGDTMQTADRQGNKVLVW